MIYILFTYLYIRDLNIIPQCEEFYSKIDNKKIILSVKDTDIQAYNRTVVKSNYRSKSKVVKKNDQELRTSKNRSVVKNNDQERISRHSFRRPPTDGITSSGVGIDTMRQLERMRNCSDSSPSHKNHRATKKISRRIIREEDCNDSNSTKRKKAPMKKETDYYGRRS